MTTIYGIKYVSEWEHNDKYYAYYFDWDDARDRVKTLNAELHPDDYGAYEIDTLYVY